MKIAQICPCPLCSSAAAFPSRCQADLAFDTNALDIHDVTVPVPHLPRHLEGLTIAHLTDTHLRRLGRLEESVLAAVQAREPAVVVLTGDMSVPARPYRSWPSSAARSRPPAATSWRSAGTMKFIPRSLWPTSVGSIAGRARGFL
jgi:hypothetical protein